MEEELDEQKHLKEGQDNINIAPDDNDAEEEEKKNIREGSIDLDELYKNDVWYLSTEDISNYNEFFIEADINKDGFISGYEANKFFSNAILNRKQLSEIWTLCDYNKNGKLSEAMFYVMFHIFYKISKSENTIPIPNQLPKCLTYEIIEKMRLNWRLKTSQNKEKAFNDIQEFNDKQIEKEKERKERERKNREEMLKYISKVKPLTKEEIKENKRITLRNKYDFNHRNWYFNDVLGEANGPYDINELIESWKNNEIDYNTSLYKTNQRYKTEKLTTHVELYAYISLFKQYKWYYKSNSNNINNENGPYFSYQMKQFVENGRINKDTQIKREPPILSYNNNDNSYVAESYVSLDSTYIYDIWNKSIRKGDNKYEGFLIQDTATMFLHNLCYYYFGINIYFDSISYSNDKLELISKIVIGLCIFETILISLGQFELKERLIPFKNLLMPIAIIQSILEWFVNLPIIILQIYYLYFIKWNKDIFNDEINHSIYISFVAYILHNLYKIGVIHFHHYDEFLDSNNYHSTLHKDVRRKWKCCNALHICNWAICVPVILIVFGAIFFKNDNNDYTLSLVLIILGSISCCCLACIGAIAASNL